MQFQVNTAMFGLWKTPDKQPQPTPEDRAASAFNDFATALPAGFIDQVRSEFTGLSAKSEGLDTARHILAARMMTRFPEFLGTIIEGVIEPQLGLSVSGSPKYASWLKETAERITGELATMHQQHIHQPARDPNLTVAEKAQLLIESSTDLRQRFESYCDLYYFSGAIVTVQPDVRDEMYRILAATIQERAVGDNQPLTFKEFRVALAKNVALALMR